MERWLITGASGQLGGHIVRQLASDPAAKQVTACSNRTDPATFGASPARVDLAELDAVRALVRGIRPTTVIHSGAMTAVADCFANPALARQTNTAATTTLAEECAALGARMVFVSTDMVFGGDHAPYDEGAAPAPLSVYGRTKADAEAAIIALPRTLVVRVPLMYGFACTTRSATFAQQMAAIRARTPLKLFTDEFRTPAWVVDAAHALIGLARSDRAGLIHIAGPERLSRLEMVQRFARFIGVSDPAFEPVSRLSIAGGEPRPADLSLSAARFAGEFPRLVCGPIRAEVFADASAS